MNTHFLLLPRVLYTDLVRFFGICEIDERFLVYYIEGNNQVVFRCVFVHLPLQKYMIWPVFG